MTPRTFLIIVKLEDPDVILPTDDNTVAQEISDSVFEFFAEWRTQPEDVFVYETLDQFDRARQRDPELQYALTMMRKEQEEEEQI
jgi:hypothetical protein